MISILTYYFSFINTNINEGGDGKTCQIFKCTANIHILSDMDWFVSTSLKISNRYVLRSQLKYSSFGTQVSATFAFHKQVFNHWNYPVYQSITLLGFSYIYICTYMHLHMYIFYFYIYIFIYRACVSKLVISWCLNLSFSGEEQPFFGLI